MSRPAALYAALALASILFGTFLAGYIAGQAYTRAEAVEAGAGNYTPDGRGWRWHQPPRERP